MLDLVVSVPEPAKARIIKSAKASTLGTYLCVDRWLVGLDASCVGLLMRWRDCRPIDAWR